MATLGLGALNIFTAPCGHSLDVWKLLKIIAVSLIAKKYCVRDSWLFDLELWLSHWIYERSIHVYEVNKSESSQNNLKRQNGRVCLNRPEVAMLDYVCEHQDLEKYGAS